MYVNRPMAPAIEPLTITYDFQPGHAGDPNAPDHDPTLIHTGHVVNYGA